MSTLATLVVKLVGDVSGFNKDMDSAMNKTNQWGKSLMSTGGLFTAGITTPILLGMNAMTDWASNTVESTNKVNVVFGESAGIVTAFASTSAQNLGIVESAALDAMGTYGQMFVTMGIMPDMAAVWSTNLVQMAADLGSFNNIEPNIMLDKFRAGLVGEYEPLRQVGIMIDETKVKAKAMEMGFGGVNGVLTDGEKAQARYALMVEQSALAQGDFTRTSGDLANAQRIANAMFHDTAAALGEQLLPYKLQLIQLVQRALEAFQGLSPEVQNWIIIIAAGAAALGPLILGLGAVVTALGALLSPIGLVVAAVVALALAWATNFGGIRDKTQEVIDFVRPYIETAMNFIRDIVEEVLGKIQAWWAAHGETIIQVVTAAWLTIKGAFTEATDFIRGVVEWFLGTVEGWWAQHGNSVMTIVSFLWETIKGIVETISTVISQLLSGFFNAVRGFWEEHGATITGIASNIWETIKGIIQALAAVIGGIVDGLAALIQGDWKGLEEAVTAITQGLSDFVTALWTGIKNHITMTLQILVPYIIRAWENIKESVRNKVEVLKSQLAGLWENIKTAAQNKIAEMRDAIVEHIQAMKDRMFGIIHDIISGIIGFFTNTDWGAVGRAVIEGIANGIRAGIEWVKEAARNVAQAAVDAAKGALGIHSPSKVFAAEVGKPIVEGIGIGMIDNLRLLIRLVQRAAGELKTEGVKEFATAVKEIVDVIGPALDGLMKLNAWDIKTNGEMKGRMESFSAMIGALVTHLSNSAKYFGQEGLQAVKDFAESAGAGAKILGDSIAGLEKLNAWDMATNGKMKEKMTAFSAMIGALVTHLSNSARQFSEEGLTQVKRFADAAEAAAKPIKNGLEALTLLMEFDAGKTAAISENLSVFSNFLGSLIAWFGVQALIVGDELMNKAKAFADAVEAVTKPIRTAVEGLKALGEAELPTLETAVTKMAQFMTGALVLVGFLAATGDAIKENTLSAAIAFGENIAKVAASVKVAFEALTEIAKAELPTDLQNMMTQLLEILQSGVGHTYMSGREIGQMWLRGIVDGIRSLLPDLEKVLMYVRGLFPSSPAKYGPWRHLPDGEAVGDQFAGGLASGLNRGMDTVTGALANLRVPFPAVGNAPPAGNSTTVNIYNPVGETSEMSVTRQLRNLAALGVLTA